MKDTKFIYGMLFFLVISFLIYYGVKQYLVESAVGSVIIIDKDYNLAFNKPVGFQIMKNVYLNDLNNFRETIEHGACKLAISKTLIRLEETSQNLENTYFLKDSEKIDSISKSIVLTRCSIWYVGFKDSNRG